MKAVKKLALSLIIMATLFSLAACGGITGTYRGEASGGSGEFETSASYILELKQGNEFVMTVNMTRNDETTIIKTLGTYTVDGDTLTFKPLRSQFGADNEIEDIPEEEQTEQTATIKNGEITVTVNDQVIVLKK